MNVAPTLRALSASMSCTTHQSAQRVNPDVIGTSSPSSPRSRTRATKSPRYAKTLPRAHPVWVGAFRGQRDDVQAARGASIQRRGHRWSASSRHATTPAGPRPRPGRRLLGDSRVIDAERWLRTDQEPSVVLVPIPDDDELTALPMISDEVPVRRVGVDPSRFAKRYGDARHLRHEAQFQCHEHADEMRMTADQNVGVGRSCDDQIVGSPRDPSRGNHGATLPDTRWQRPVAEERSSAWRQTTRVRTAIGDVPGRNPSGRSCTPQRSTGRLLRRTSACAPRFVGGWFRSRDRSGLRFARLPR